MPLLNNLYFKFRRLLADRLPKFYFFCETKKSIIKFFLAGCFVSLNDLFFLFIFHGLFKIGIVISTSLAFILSFTVSFTLHKFWAFRNYNQGNAIGQIILYFLNAFLVLSVNGFLMHYFVNEIYIWYILSQIIVNLIIGIYNFIIYKFIIFKIDGYEIDCQKETT